MGHRGAEIIAKEVLADAVDLGKDLLEPFGEFATVGLVRICLGERSCKIDVLTAKFDLQLEGRFWDVDFDGFKHVHYTCRIASVPDLIVVIVAARH